MDDDSLPLIASLILGLCAIGLSWFAGSDAPYVTTKDDKIEPLFKAAGIKNGTVFYELGSGDGRLVLAAAKHGANANGVEQSWIRVWMSRYQAWKQKLPNSHFFHGNIFARSYYPADIIYIFLLPEGVKKLEKKLKKELKPGAVVITQTFHFKTWKPFKKLNLTKGEKPIASNDRKPGDFWFYRV
jgi:hypothetical protein